MPNKTTIWNDGTGNNIYFNFDNIDLAKILITSDPNNTGVTRIKPLILRANSNNLQGQVYVSIEQRFGEEWHTLVTFDNVAAVYNEVKVLTYNK